MGISRFSTEGPETSKGPLAPSLAVSSSSSERLTSGQNPLLPACGGALTLRSIFIVRVITRKNNVNVKARAVQKEEI